MSDKELKEYTAFLKTRKALIDGDVDSAVKAFRDYVSGNETVLTAKPSEYDYNTPKLAYIPMWKFLDIAISVVYPDRSSGYKPLHAVVVDNVLAIYNGKSIKYIDCRDVIKYFKLSEWDSLYLPSTQFDVVKRNTPDMERDVKTKRFYDYFDKSYIFDNGDVLPADFMGEAYVMLVTCVDTTRFDYTDNTTLGETYYRFNENGNPIKCCVTKTNTDGTYEMEEYHLVYGHRHVSTLNQHVFKINDTKYCPADFSYVNKYYLHVVVNDVVETVGGLPLKVFDVERNQYNAVASFKAHVLGNPKQFIHYDGFGEVLTALEFTDQTTYTANNWLKVSKIITDPEKDLLTFVEGNEFVKEYTLFHKDDETFYETFTKEECETLFSIFNQHGRVLIDANEVDLSTAVNHLSKERKDGKIIRNVAVSANLLNFNADLNNSIAKMFRGKTFSEFPVTVYQGNKIHLLFKTGNGLRWFIVRPNRKGIVLNVLATDAKYKPKQKRYEETYTSYSLSYNGE